MATMSSRPSSTFHLLLPPHPLLFPSHQNPSLSRRFPPPKPCLSPPPSSLSLSKTKPHHLSFSSSTSQLHQSSLPNKQSHLPDFPPDTPSAPPPSLEDAQILYSKCIKRLRVSARHGDVELAKAVHASVLKFEECTFLVNALIITYLKLGRVSDAYTVFGDMLDPDVVSYTAFISCFAKSGYEFDAIELFFEMRENGVEPNKFTFVALLTACNRLMELELGFVVHSLIIRLGLLCNVYIANALMGLYYKCGYLGSALQLFDKMSERDVASWNTIIVAMVNELKYENAFGLFRKMQKVELCRADHVTLCSVMSACAGCCAYKAGREVHAHALKIGYEGDLIVNNALIAFYTRCGRFEDVEALFRRIPIKDVFTWTSMITACMEFGRVDLAMHIFDTMPERNSVSYTAVLAGLSRNNYGAKALGFFRRMVMEGVEITDQALTSAIAAASLVMEKNLSEEIHGFAVKFGCGSNSLIEAALFDMFTRCGRMPDAQKMFFRLDRIRTVDWTSMIGGYARNGQPEEALTLFHKGVVEGTMDVDEVASAVVLGLCGILGHEGMGKQIHCHALKSGYLYNLEVVSGIISMYSKCCNMEDAIKIFNAMSARDTVSWNSLISGHLLHRNGDEALALWSRMELEWVKPDPLTFLLVVSSYLHTRSNLVKDCRRLFHSMKAVYNIEPTSDHYAAFVSVLSRWASLEEAEDTIVNMPFEPEPNVWRALLKGCRVHSDFEIGKRTIKRILQMDPQDPSTYILVANLYSASARWHCSEMIRAEMRRKGFSKHPSRSWIVHQSRIHSFYARDRSHVQTKDIYSGLQILVVECMKAGYVPDTSFVLHEVEEYQKYNFLCYHSAKLAFTYGLLMTRAGRPIRVLKNILLCGDCHNFLKYASVVTKRDICLRDTSGFHFFSDGKCSCKDHW
ncbi:hypothetical protein Dimus_034671 [Dionaea muscipula]